MNTYGNTGTRVHAYPGTTLQIPIDRNSCSNSNSVPMACLVLSFAIAKANAQMHTYVHKCANAQMHKCTNAQMHNCTIAQLHNCTNAQMLKRTNAQMLKCSNARMLKYSNAQITHSCRCGGTSCRVCERGIFTRKF